jgi:hypothetical protein
MILGAYPFTGVVWKRSMTTGSAGTNTEDETATPAPGLFPMTDI